MKVKITYPGQQCRHCNGRVEFKEHKPGFRPGPKQPWFFKRWLKCPKCKAIFHLESEKVMLIKPLKMVEYDETYTLLDLAIANDKD